MSSLRPTARVARGATYLFVQGLVCAVIGVVYFVVLVRLLTPEEVGVYAVLTFLLALVQVLKDKERVDEGLMPFIAEAVWRRLEGIL